MIVAKAEWGRGGGKSFGDEELELADESLAENKVIVWRKQFPLRYL